MQAGGGLSSFLVGTPAVQPDLCIQRSVTQEPECLRQGQGMRLGSISRWPSKCFQISVISHSQAFEEVSLLIFSIHSDSSSHKPNLVTAFVARTSQRCSRKRVSSTSSESDHYSVMNVFKVEGSILREIRGHVYLTVTNVISIYIFAISFDCTIQMKKGNMKISQVCVLHSKTSASCTE